MVNRRTFFTCAAAAGTMAIPSTLRAQTTRRPRVVWVGFGPLMPGDEALQAPWHQGFRDLGYVNGQNILLEYRYVEAAAEGRAERMAKLLAVRVRHQVDVLFSPRPEVVLAAMRATRAVPIVFATIGDPVGTGLVESLARPGGNVTGIAFDSSPEIAAKNLQLLHELVPQGQKFGMLQWQSPDAESFVPAARSAGIAMGLQLIAIEVHEKGELGTAFADLVRQSAAGIIVMGSAYAWVHRDELIALAATHRMPAIYANRDSVIGGGLISYGPVLADEFRRAAASVDKILRGARPSDLPVEQPTKFELVVSLKTAKALGLAIPRSLLLQADEVIQ